MKSYYNSVTSTVRCPACGKSGLKDEIAQHAEQSQDERHRDLRFEDVW